jgi:photosystem II stability/assembly factor-like uncharacterized protein
LQEPTFPKETINDMYFSNPLNGFMAVNAGIVGRTTDGGNTWVPIETPTYQNLTCLGASSATNIWCGGQKGTLLKSTDGGFRWQTVNLNDTLTTLTSVSFPVTDTGFACGGSYIFRTLNGGTSWTRQSFSPAPWQANAFSYLKFFSRDTGYAYSTGKLLKTVDGGTNWSVTAMNGFYMVRFATKQIGYGVGRQGNNDTYFKTIDGGTTWQQLATVLNYNPQITGMHVMDSLHVYILNNGTGQGNTRLYYTSNGGQSWQNNNYIPEMHWSSTVFFTSATIGHVSDIWGSCRKTYDRGNNWATPSNDYYGSGADAIAAANTTHLWAVSSALQKRSTNGGSSWTPGAVTAYDIVKMQFKSTTTGYALTDNNYLKKTTNAGQNWNYNSAAGTIRDFAFYSPNFGMVSRNGAIARTYDGGTNWITVSLSATSDVKAIACADSLYWFAGVYNTTTSEYNIYKSSNGGVNWNVVSTGITNIYNLESLAATDSNHVYFAGGNGVYRSANGGQTFQLWGTIPQDPWVNTPVNKIVVPATDKVITISPLNLVATSMPNVPRLFARDTGDWKVSPIHSSFPFVDITSPDTTVAWALTSFGSIYRYYPSGTCPPNVLKPFLSLSAIAGCPGTNVVVNIGNYNYYTLPYDTLKAQLLSGNTVLWIGTPGTGGQLSVPIPTTAGTYQLRVTVSNPDVPGGFSTTIPVTPLNNNPPQFNAWHSACNTGCCAGTGVAIGVSSSYNLGTGYTYELHKINKYGQDSVIDMNNTSTSINNITDTFRLYYKVILGTGVCYPSPYFYSDTIPVNVVYPALAKTTMSTSAINGRVCSSGFFTVTTSAIGGAPFGRFYEFFGITSSGVQSLGSGPDSVLVLNGLPASPTKVYSRMYPGWGGCVLPDTVTSDTLTLTTINATQPAVSSNINPGDSLCQGKTLVLFLDTAVIRGFDHWELYTYTMPGPLLLLDTGRTNTWADTAATPGAAYYFVVKYVEGCVMFSDTIYPHIAAPQAATITQLPSGDLAAQPTNALQYRWYLNGLQYTVTTVPLLPQPPSGFISMQVTMADSCEWLEAGPIVVTLPSGVRTPTLDGWQLYPNPGTGQVWIKAPAQLKQAALTVMDMTGKQVYQTQLALPLTQPLSLNLVPGTYMVRLVNGAQTATFKLEITRP